MEFWFVTVTLNFCIECNNIYKRNLYAKHGKAVLVYFRFLWLCIMNVGWRERNQQDAINLMFIEVLSQHVSGIIMPIIRRTRPCTTAYGILHCNKRGKNRKMWEPYCLCGVVHGLVRLMMGIMMPETCWDRILIIKIRLVASCWFLSLHPRCACHFLICVWIMWPS